MRPRFLVGYCPDDGLFYFNGRVICMLRQRYRFIAFSGKRYRAHIFAWFLMTGEWPSHQIDHINRDKTDNRWCNLRAATPSQNRANTGIPANNISGIRNVRRYRNKYHAQIAAYGKKYHLGYFDDPIAAEAACRAKRAEIFGEYAA